MNDLRFHFGPLESRGVLLGLRGGQLGFLVASAGAAVGCVAALPLAVGGALAVAALTGGLAATFLDVGGRGIDEWLPVGARHAGRRIAGLDRRLSRDHMDGHHVGADAGVRSAERRSVAQPLRHLCIQRLPDGPQGQELGVVVDTLRGTSTAVIAVRAAGFALLGDHEKERRLAGWAAAMEGQCRDSSHLHRLQWIERSVAGVARATDDRSTSDDAVHASYRDVLGESGPAHQSHELLIAVQIRWSSCSRAIRAADRRSRHRGAALVLAREVDALLQRLPESGAQCCRPLGADEFGRRLSESLGVRVAAEAGTAASTASPAPAAIVERWDHVVVDAIQHATYWIREWPRVDVGPDFLGPLLLQTAVTRTVSVTMSFEPPRCAQRQAESSLTADLADEDVRHRAGFVSGFRRRREREDAARRGEEIADGHGSVRFSGYITVSAPFDATLADACADVELRAQQSHLDIQRLFGQQLETLTYTLPLARGLR